MTRHTDHNWVDADIEYLATYLVEAVTSDHFRHYMEKAVRARYAGDPLVTVDLDTLTATSTFSTDHGRVTYSIRLHDR